MQETLLILIGGDETTRHVISGGMLALLEHPDQLGRARRAIPSRCPTAVEELLRWVSPVKNMSRTVTRDVEVRGQQLHEGDQLILFYPSANRDEDVFDDARRARRRAAIPTRTWPSASAPHFCLGASLARLELRVMFGEVLAPAARPRARRRPSRPVPRVELRQRPRVDARPLHAHPATREAPMSGPLGGRPGGRARACGWRAPGPAASWPTGAPTSSRSSRPRATRPALFARMLGGDLDVNPVFELDNRGKRSIVLDLSSDRGSSTSCSSWWPRPTSSSPTSAPAALERLGLGPDALRGALRRLVYAIITGYGLDGPDADRAAYDIAAFWARSGMAEALRTPGRPAAVPARPAWVTTAWP